MAGTINKPKKPKSKRTPVRLRHKIEKAAAAKQRKQRKLAKKNPEWRSKLKKDPGIPNLFPYKDRLLHQIEEDRARRKEEQQRRREMAKAASTAQPDSRDEDDEDMVEDAGVTGDFLGEADADDAMDEDASDIDESNPLAALVASARKAAEQYEKELQSGDEMEDDGGYDDSDDDGAEAGTIQVPGGATSRKAYDKVFKQVVEQADVILYVLDARDPEGTRSRDVERAVMAAAGGGKRLILVLNKVDLIPPPVLRGWLAHLRRFFPTLPLRASGPAPNAHTFNHRDITLQSTSAALFRALKAYAASRNLKRAISVGVIGYPNVGKSSVINALLSRLGGGQRAACPAGAEAGVTTAIRAVKIDSKLTLLDSPGIVFPSTPASATTTATTTTTTTTNNTTTFIPKNPTEAHAHLVLLNAVPPKQIDDPVPAVALLLRRLAAAPGDLLDRMMRVYDLPPLLGDPRSAGTSTDTGADVTTDFLIQVARKRGRLGRGGVPNLQAAAMTVVTDWRDGRIQGWVDPPPPPPTPAQQQQQQQQQQGAGGKAGNAGGGKIADLEVMADQKEIVTEWAKEFKLDGLWGDDDQGMEQDG